MGTGSHGTTRSPRRRVCKSALSAFFPHGPTSLFLLLILPRYSFSVAAHRLWWLLLGGCSPLTLRMTNWLVIVTVPIVASQCRRLLETRPIEPTAAPHRSRSSSPPPSQQQQPSALSVYALHSGLNIAFFPLLFFFSGLYYTDVLSTLVVLAAFWHTLVRTNDVQQQYAPRRRRQAQGAHSWRSDGLVVVLGVAALLMRQTNVFWVVVFMGGLEAVHAAGALRPPPTRPGAFDRPTKIKYYLSKYSQGEIHDPPLDAVSLDGTTTHYTFSLFVFAIIYLCSVGGGGWACVRS